MSAEIKSLVLDTWAGRRYYAVELVGQTPKKARVRVLTPGGVMLPGRRYANCGETVLVPKHALVDLPAHSHKVEQGYYDGHVLALRSKEQAPHDIATAIRKLGQEGMK